jgi:transglutaminase 1
MIWLGSSDSNSPRPWQYGQFAGAALAVAMQLMDASGGLPLTQRRGDLTQLTRFFSKWINVNDDNGVLVGRWSEPYSDGTEPWVWTGSDAIFRQFFQTGRPVKYGQCWVFSGCLTSILRAVGLAARSITNFESAHEPAPYQFTIDRYWVQRNGQVRRVRAGGARAGVAGADASRLVLQWQQSDMRGSIWNFHAWTDVWISRSDISDASGWQAVDATPQETSGGYFQLGPASLAMVRANERDSQYDADFVISETNADVVDWVQQSGKWVVYARDTKTVGQLMSTKAVGSNSRDDITSDYKTESDSIEAGSRRARVLGARPRGSGKQLMLLDGADWHVDVHVPNAVALGANVSITVSVSRRPGSAPVNLTLNSLVVNLTDYTNSNPVQIDWLDAPYAMPLLGNTTSLSHVFTVLPTAYQSLVSNGFTYLTVVAWAASDAPGPNFMMAEANSRLVQPDMSIVLMDASGQVTSSFRVGDTVRAEFAFTNPLSIALTHVTVHAEISSGYNIAPITVSDVGPMQQMRVPYTGTATTASDSPISIVVILDCDQLDGVTGYAQIRVSPADEPEHKSPLLSPLGIALTTVACVVLLGVGVAVGVAIARRRRASNDAKASVQDEAVATGDYASDANYAKLPGDG